MQEFWVSQEYISKTASKISIYKWLIIVFSFIFQVGILDVALHEASIPGMTGMHVVENT